MMSIFLGEIQPPVTCVETDYPIRMLRASKSRAEPYQVFVECMHSLTILPAERKFV